MKPEELAFANEQLAGMLKSGLPLEGSLRELAASMKRGALRTELSALEKDLAKGTALPEALEARALPPLYVKMLQVGAAANNLPAVLQWLADHYARANTTWLRLKGLLVYPLLVLVAATAMSIAMFWMTEQVMDMINYDEWWSLGLMGGTAPEPVWMHMCRWAPPIMLLLVLLLALVALALPGARRKLRWRLPGFREAGLAQVAGSLAMLLRGGCPLGEALALVRELEADSPAGADLAQWHERLAQGAGKPSQFAQPSKVFPPLFTWVIASGGENLADGFERAAEIYHARQLHRTETVLYAALPMAILVLGALIVLQMIPLFAINARMMDWLGM